MATGSGNLVLIKNENIGTIIVINFKDPPATIPCNVIKLLLFLLCSPYNTVGTTTYYIYMKDPNVCMIHIFRIKIV